MLYSTTEVARLLGLHGSTVQHHSRNGVIPLRKIGGRCYLKEEDFIKIFGVSVGQITEYKYSVKEAAAIAGYTYAHFVELVREKKVPSILIGRKPRLCMSDIKNHVKYRSR